MLIFLLGGVGMLYLITQNQAKKTPLVPGAAAPNSTTRPGQPSQMYPYKPTQSARVDNANQPWYHGSTAGMGGPSSDLSGMGAFAQTVQAGSSVVHSLADVWGTLSSTFGGNDAKSNLISTDSLPTQPAVATNWTPDTSVKDTLDLGTGGNLADEYGYTDVSSVS